MPFLLTQTGVDPNYQGNMGENVVITDPEGLNYDENGNLVALFYYYGVDAAALALGNPQQQQALMERALMLSLPESRDYFLPNAFSSSHENWHSHYGVCLGGVNYPAMQQDPSIIPYFQQQMTPNQCYYDSVQRQQTPSPDLAWMSGLNMMHLWLYKLNPCGIFGGHNPDVDKTAPVRDFYTDFDTWRTNMGI